IAKKYDNVKLLLVGDIEEKDAISKNIKQKIFNNERIIYVGFQDNPIPYFYAMDIFVFPTYMEGFGNTSIEAQATGTPVIATNATGVIDTFIDNETGFSVKIKNVNELVEKIEAFINNKELVVEMGRKAKKYAQENFYNEIIWNGLENLYKNNI